MLDASPKGTVPVLIASSHTLENEILEESLDIALWALRPNEQVTRQHQLFWGMQPSKDAEQLAAIKRNDSEFKYWLDRYKYHVGHREYPREYYRNQAKAFLAEIEALLNDQTYLFDDQPSLADLMIFPFVRQFAFVDKEWFDRANYPRLQTWLNNWIDSEEFRLAMQKHVEWKS